MVMVDGQPVVVPTENVAEVPTHEATPALVLDDHEYVMFLHSHTQLDSEGLIDPRSPSKQDMEAQLLSGREWGLAYCDGSQCTELLTWGNPHNRPPLLGREFILNIQDCYEIARDWHFQDSGIELPAVPRSHDWIHKGEDLIMETFSTGSFQAIAASINNNCQPGDIVLMKTPMSPVVNHVAVYVGNGEVLTHHANQLSVIKKISAFEGKAIKYVIRPVSSNHSAARRVAR